MLRSISNFFVKLAERWMPDPLVIAITLTMVCFAAAVLFTPFGMLETVDAWGVGYWSLLTFTCQMILILALGHVVAHTAPVNRALVWISRRVTSAPMAYIGLTVLAGLCALVSWGIGLIVPAVLARIIAENCRERGIRIHFPLLVACGYSGSVVGMQGLSASIPLILNTPDHFLYEEVGLIGLNQTIFSPWSMAIVAAVLIFLPLALTMAAPRDEDIREMPLSADLKEEAEVPVPRSEMTPSQRVENSRLVTLTLGVFGAVYAGEVLRHRWVAQPEFTQHELRSLGSALRKLHEALRRTSVECSEGGRSVPYSIPALCGPYGNDVGVGPR